MTNIGITTQTKAEPLARGSNLITSDQGGLKCHFYNLEVMFNPILSDSIRFYPRETLLTCYLCFGYSSVKYSCKFVAKIPVFDFIRFYPPLSVAKQSL